ncbi:RrF2 family transcriptional regulator [Micromonospora endophytica]|uniref:Rrf2 family transcriptional regulator n=1 Tax=Micromonospora endophytica TaxID=515350 RepID=A0A2W2D221_9ACTN|nr:Rrf2 family transcriptional regulator [Micromonospora endophytica]PZF86563.1 Rrf2 family transcriptional regulator [Micromonospora endophytica]RIW47951.1 Rrf2 family transcriptional regulator [Micromonospora endophytica]BCJ62335.1 Rrf2 family transcriptional regulator [Micromonospora endophytica]
MYVSARSDYAVRAMLAVAQHHPDVVKAATLAASQDIPYSFLQGILLDLRRAGLLLSLRGADGGYALTRDPGAITIGDVLRATGGALTTVRGAPAEVATYHGVAVGLGAVWRSVHQAIEGVVDHASLADLLAPADRSARDAADRPPRVA